MKFYAEVELAAGAPVGEERFDAMAEALYDLDGSDPEISDADLCASLAEGTTIVSLTVEAEDPVAVITKALRYLAALLEDFADAVVACKARASIEAGEPLIPWEEVKANLY